MDVEQALSAQFLQTHKAALVIGVVADGKATIRQSLQYWHNVSDDSDPVRILRRFIDIATQNGLGNTLAVQKLRDAEKLFAVGGTYDSTPIMERIVHGAAYQDIPAWEKAKDMVIKNILLYNIWDCLSYIYTLRRGDHFDK